MQERQDCFMAWLLARPEKHIAVVSHSAFLHYLIQDLCGCAPEAWHNGEMRTLKLQADGSAVQCARFRPVSRS